MEEWRREQSDWLITNFAAASLLSVTETVVGRPESCLPHGTTVVADLG